MKQVTYRSLKSKNFMSIGDDQIEIKFKRGLNMITGQNLDNPERKNAVGKSTVMNAFFWGVFGDTIGKISNKNIINYITKKKGYVEIEFDVNENGSQKSYKILRKLKPNSVELYEDGVDVTRDSVRNTNSKICDIIGSNALISKCVDIMSISDNAPFMTQTAESKRKFISNIFNIIIFDVMKKMSKEDTKTNNVNKKVVDGKIITLESSLDSLMSKRDAVTLENANRRDKYRKILQKYVDRIANVEDSINQLVEDGSNSPTMEDCTSQLEDFINLETETTNKLSKLKDVYSKITNKIEILSKEMEKMCDVTVSKCPKCLQDVGEDHLQHLQEEISANTLEQEEYKVKLDKIRTGVRTYTKKVEKITDKIRIIKENVASIKENMQQKRRLDIQLSDLRIQKEDFCQSFDDSDSENTFEQLIEETELKLKDVDEELTEYRTTSDVLDVCNFVLGDEGVKSIVIKKLLNILNNNISKYLGLMGLDKRCEFDEYFDETIKSKGGVETSYYNCSGAERKTIDVACSLAFSDLRQRTCGVYSNIKFFDEIFDSAFDERGLDMFIEMLKNKIDASGWAVYAISHRKEAIKHIDGQVIELVKHNNVTSLK